MSEHVANTQNERGLAGLAHGSILLGVFTGGVGGIIAALIIWLTQKDKSAYAAYQSLQALVYQGLTLLVTTVCWCCWGALYMAMILAPIISNPDRYEDTPPATVWLGLVLMIIPLAVWGLTVLYGLYASARCFGGHDFKYAVIGNWLESQDSN
jgi:uncharacterized Tic20 family protein